MQKREKILAGVVAGLVLLLICYSLLGRVADAFSQRRTQITTLQGTVRERQALEKRGQQAADQLAQWEHRSLPSNQTTAKSLYLKWLMQSADRAKLKDSDVTATGRSIPHRSKSSKDVYYSLAFNLKAKANLDQSIAFLHEFYSANHLHRLREVSLTPVSKSSDLDLNLTIEALVLPGADRSDALNEERSNRLKLAAVDPYQQTIGKRNLFAAYSPPPPPIAFVPRSYGPSTPSFDKARFAILTAILEVGDGPQAWVSIKTTGELIRLREGDKVSVGGFNGTVTRINVSDIEIESDGKRRQLALGKSLPQSVEIAQEAYYEQ